MNKKVQEWLDAYEDRNLLPSSPSVTSSTEPTLFIADEHTAVSNDAAIVISSSSSSSSNDAAIVISSSSSNSSSNSGNDHDMQVTVMNIDRIWNRAEAMMNQNTFDAAVDAACVRYACNEVVRILDLSEDEYYVPSFGLIMHILRWVVIALEERFGKMQWSLDMADTVRATIASRYAGKNDVTDSD